jgi:hypothetical protein
LRTNRHQQFELERLSDLAGREDLAAAAEERIAGLINAMGQAQSLGDR